MSFSSELTRVIEQVGKDRGIKKEIIIDALKQAIIFAAKKKIGMRAKFEAEYNDETGEIELFQFKTVVEDDDVADDSHEIELGAAKQLDPEAQLGDEIGIKCSQDFGRIDAQTAKQIIFQKVRDAEREIIFSEYSHRKGELISGIVRRVEGGNLIVDLGKTDCVLPRKEIIPGENYKAGDRVHAYLLDVVLTARGPSIIISRTCPQYLIRLFENEVPEIRENIVEIKGAAREPGLRAKIAVFSKDRDVDPVGACVGMKGMRVQNVVSELKGERIDIIPWSEHPEVFVRKALQPSEVESIKVNYDQHSMECVVPDDQLSLAIGKKGVNVRLAAMLTGWKLDIISKSKLQRRQQEAVFQLKHIEGVSDTIAQLLYQRGFLSLQNVIDASVDQLTRVDGVDAAFAEVIKTRAKEVLEKGGDAILLPVDQTPEEAVTKTDFSSSSGTGTKENE